MPPRCSLAWNEVGRAQELGHEAVPGVVVDLLRCADLDHPATAHHGQPIAADQGLGLVVGDQDKGVTQLALQTPQIFLDLGPQARIQGAHGFRPAGERPAR